MSSVHQRVLAKIRKHPRGASYDQIELAVNPRGCGEIVPLGEINFELDSLLEAGVIRCTGGLFYDPKYSTPPEPTAAPRGQEPVTPLFANAYPVELPIDAVLPMARAAAEQEDE